LCRLIVHANGRNRRESDMGQPAEEGPVSDPKATFDDAALAGSSCPRPWKNASAEAADALCFAGVRAETAIDRLARAA